LIVDADERLTPELAAEIRALLAAPPADIDGYLVNRKNHLGGHHIAHCGWNSDYVLRLFRRDRAQYHNRWVHAEIDLPRERIGRLKNRLLHFTANSSEHHWSKLNRYATWGALNYRDKGRRPSYLHMTLHPMLRFFQLYVLRLGFLYGFPGLQVCAHTAFSVFLKQTRLWELAQADKQTGKAEEESSREPNAIRLATTDAQPVRTSRAA
jgi:hypothetical protein